jgi:hypothetical protein
MSKAAKQRASGIAVCYDTIPDVRYANKLDDLIRSKLSQQVGTGFFTRGGTGELFEHTYFKKSTNLSVVNKPFI